MKFYSIGEIAKQSGCSVQLIRHYEKIGLLDKIERTGSNRRLYTEEHLKTILFIRHGRSMGFSLSDITRLLSLKNEEGHNQKVRNIAQDHLMQVNERIKHLSQLQGLLQSIIHQCEETCKSPSHDKACPIIGLLNSQAPLTLD